MRLPAAMLLTSGTLPEGDRWRFEVKFDGVRALVSVHAGCLQVRSRHGTALTRAFPEFEALGSQLPDGTVLDTELVVPGAGGRPDFAAVRRRLTPSRPATIEAAARTWPAHLMSFDVLAAAGRDMCTLPWRERRERLEMLLADVEGPVTAVLTVDDGAALHASTRQLGLEGVVAKQVDAPYRPGVRSPAWVKVKHTEQTALQVVAARRRPGGPTEVLVAGADGRPIGWLERTAAAVTRRELTAGLGTGAGVVWGDGPLVVVRHLLGDPLREPVIVAVRPRTPLQQTG